MNVCMKTFTTVQMSSTSVSTLAARTSVNVNKIYTSLMENAEVISNGLIYYNEEQLFVNLLVMLCKLCTIQTALSSTFRSLQMILFSP